MFETLPLAANAGAFIGAAIVVWLAGTRLARSVGAISEKTGIGDAVVGIFLLGGVTSLPELAVAVTATLGGTPELSVNDVLGSAAINVLVLAIADAVLGRSAITSTPPSPSVLLQGALAILLLSLVVAAVMAGDLLVLGVGAWSWLILGAYFAAIWVIAHSKGVRAWVPAKKKKKASAEESGPPQDDRSLRALIGQTIGAGVAILVAGFVLARTGAAIAEQSGLGTSFVGAVLLAMATSMPEVSTAVAAVRLRRYEMAIADIFGTNLFNVTIIVAVDALHPGPPVLEEAGPFAGFAALIALVLTAIYLVGMIERRDRTVLRMGFDSLAVLAVYAGGLVVLYHLR